MMKQKTRERAGTGRGTVERGRETETRILDAAELVLARVGFAGARTQEIADTAGVTKAMIHYYFDSKERLYRAVLDRILFELIKLVQEATAEEQPRVQRLSTFINGFFDYVARHPHFGRLTYMGSGGKQPYFDSIVRTFFGPLFGRGVRFIEAGVAEGVFCAVDARQLLLSIYAAAMGYFADAHFISLMLEEDAMGKAILAERRAALLDMVLRTLGVDTGRPLG
ncbi:MAG: TetR family transcriptional regulator [Candidatus Schekmanbacteria bacterium]|nr:TetR family transcriptional regulator [Candidatus Schekmanbacteria bacterium]